MILALTSDTLTPGPDVRRRVDDPRSRSCAQVERRRPGHGRRQRAAGGARRARTRRRSRKYGIGLEDVRAALAAANANRPRARSRTATGAGRSTPTTRRRARPSTAPLIVAYRNGAPVRLSDVAEVDRLGARTCATRARPTASRAVLRHHLPPARRQHHRDRRPRARRCCRAARVDPGGVDLEVVIDRTTTIRASLREVERALLIAIVLVDRWWCSCSCATLRADADPGGRRAGVADRHASASCTSPATASTTCR